MSQDEMGCINTSAKVEPLPEILTVLETPTAPPETDPRLSLNARQVFRLKKNCKFACKTFKIGNKVLRLKLLLTC